MLCTVKKAGSVPLSAVTGVDESIHQSVLQNAFGVYLGASWAHTLETKSSRLGVYNPAQIALYLGVQNELGVCHDLAGYNDFGACNDVHLVVWFQVCRMLHDV